jgi:cation diffusion facilitator family transporter
MSPQQLGIRAALIGVVVNVGLAIVKIAAGVFGHSQALIADGIESLADLLSSFVVIGGIHISTRPADERHPYGHGKAEPLAGIVVASMLLLAAAWIAWQSIREIRTPQQGPALFTLPVLIAVVVIKEVLSRSVWSVGRRLGSTAIRGDAWHHRSDAITSAAAAIGITIALVGGPGFEAADDWAALAACVVIAFNGARLIRESVDDLMDTSVEPELLAEVKALAAGVDGVLAIEKCRIRKSGLALAMDIHVIVDGDISVRQGHQIAHEVKDRLLGCGKRIEDVTVHIEPHDGPLSD